jgi:hypothetical protein
LQFEKCKWLSIVTVFSFQFAILNFHFSIFNPFNSPRRPLTGNDRSTHNKTRRHRFTVDLPTSDRPDRMAVTEFDNAKPAPWYDRVSDRFNAILIKESRQSLKSRQFVVTFLLLLAVAWVASVFGLLNFGDELEFGAVGREFFVVFYYVLAFAAVVIVPFGAFRSLLAERDLNTFDLLSITTLSPRQIVWGKLLSAGLQLFLFYSAVTPFMAFASLLQGFNTASAGFILIATLLLSLLLSMAALMLSTFARHRVLTGAITAGVLSGLVGSYFGGLLPIVSIAVYRELVSVSNPDFWWGTGLVVLAAISYFVLFQQIAVAQLTFDSDNRSSGIRIVCTVQFWLLWLAFGAFCYFRSILPSDVILQMLAGLSALHWAVAGLMFSTEGDHLSRRVRRHVPRGRLTRTFAAPFLPGGARGYLLALAHLAALWLIVLVVLGQDGLRPAGISSGDYYRGVFDPLMPTWTPTLRFTTVVCCYAAVYLGIGTALGRWGRQISNEVTAAHARVIVILVFTAGVIFPLVLRATEAVKSHEYTVFDLTAPPSTCQYVIRRTPASDFAFDWSAPRESVDQLVRSRGYGDVIVVLLAAAAVVGLLTNSAAMWKGMFGLEPLKRNVISENGPPELTERQVGDSSLPNH